MTCPFSALSASPPCGGVARERRAAGYSVRFRPMRADADFEPLLTDRLRLRRSVPEDAETISAYRSDPEVNRTQGWERTDPGASGRTSRRWPPGRRESRVDGCSSRSRSATAAGSSEMWASVLRTASRASSRSATRSRRTSRDAVTPRRRSRRWSTTRSNTLGAEVVRAYADADNTPSIRVAEKVGMRLIERFEHREGDEVWYGVRYERRREDAPAA